jgi:hypothetical protein
VAAVSVPRAERATAITVNLDAPVPERIVVQLACLAGEGPGRPPFDLWAVRKRRWCLGKDDKWRLEPTWAGRDAVFLAQCRFSLDEALDRARRTALIEASMRADAR